MKRIAYLALYPPNTAPSQRFRVEQYLPYLAQEGFAVDILPFYSSTTYELLYSRGDSWRKIGLVLWDYLRRFADCLRLAEYDVILVQRAVTPLGPAVLEYLIAKWWRKPLVYDFDDAIWIPDPESSSLSRLLKSYSRAAHICGIAREVVVGNDYLANYAQQYADSVTIIPTVVDTKRRYRARPTKEGAKVIIGWTGSHSTMRYLKLVAEALDQLDTGQFSLRIVSNQRPDFLAVPFEYIPWSPANEIEVLQAFDIGIMPLLEDPWSRGKCGFKAIQYMALGIPAVVSPIGVNRDIVEHGVNGYHATDTQEWVKCLQVLLDNANLRQQLGQAARARVEHHYSVRSAVPKWVEVLQRV
jgi:glycosyltransferase involved in cell wall biosynthesis